MHPILAIRAFFAALFGRTIPKEVLPAGLLPTGTEGATDEVADLKEKLEVAEAKLAKLESTKPEPDATIIEGPTPEGVAVTTLAILQTQGRLLDFLSEDVSQYSDEDIGAAVREVHRDCNKALEEHFKLSPVREEEEDSLVTVPDGYDPSEIRLVGNVVGAPPFSGTLKHRGWRAQHVRLPQIPPGTDNLVIAPAEVEV